MSDNSLPDVTSPTDVTSLHEVKDDVTFLFINHWCHYYGLSGDVRRRLLKAHTEQQLHIASLTPSLIRQLEMPPAESQVLRGAMLQYLSLKKEVDDHICRQIVTEQYGEEGVYKKGSEPKFDVVAEQMKSLELRLESLPALRSLEIENMNNLRQRIRKKRIPTTPHLTLAERIAQTRNSMNESNESEPVRKESSDREERAAAAYNGPDQELMEPGQDTRIKNRRNRKKEKNKKKQKGIEENDAEEKTQKEKGTEERKEKKRDKEKDKRKKKKQKDGGREKANGDERTEADEKEEINREEEDRENEDLGEIAKEPIKEKAKNKKKKKEERCEKEEMDSVDCEEKKKKKKKTKKKDKGHKQDEKEPRNMESAQEETKREKNNDDEDDGVAAEQEETKREKKNDDEDDGVAEQERDKKKKKRKDKKKRKKEKSKEEAADPLVNE